MSKKDFISRLVASSYDDIATEFDRTRQAAWDLTDLVSSITAGSNVLDVGCGNGRLLKAVPDVNFTYIGCDGNGRLLEQAKLAFPEREFFKVSLPYVPKFGQQFDFIYMVAVFHHIVDRKDRLFLLQRLRQLLKPNGQLIMTNWNLFQPRYIRYIAKWPMRKIAWNDFFIPWGPQKNRRWRYYHSFTRRELRALLHTAGFKHSMTTKERGNLLTKAVLPE